MSNTQKPPQRQKGISGQCNLDNAVVNLNAIRESAKSELAELLYVFIQILNIFLFNNTSLLYAD